MEDLLSLSLEVVNLLLRLLLRLLVFLLPLFRPLLSQLVLLPGLRISSAAWLYLATATQMKAGWVISLTTRVLLLQVGCLETSLPSLSC